MVFGTSLHTPIFISICICRIPGMLQLDGNIWLFNLSFRICVSKLLFHYHLLSFYIIYFRIHKFLLIFDVYRQFSICDYHFRMLENHYKIPVIKRRQWGPWSAPLVNWIIRCLLVLDTGCLCRGLSLDSKGIAIDIKGENQYCENWKPQKILLNNQGGFFGFLY